MVFCCCCRRCLRLSCCLGTMSLSLLVDLPALCVLRVSRAWRMFHMSWRLRCFCCLFLLIVFVDPNARVVGDQGFDFAWSAWGFLSRNVLLFVLTYRRCGDWHPCDNNRLRDISFVMMLTTLSRCSCCVHWQGRLVASRRIVAMASLVTCKVFALQALASLVENDVDSARRDRRWWCHCLLSLVATVPSSDAYVVFMARF